jgi:hypothetical protein
MQMMRPDDIAKTGTEHAIQSALMCWVNCAMNHGFEAADIWAAGGLLPIRPDNAPKELPALKWLHAVPNGGSRGDTAKSRAIRGAQLKAEGVKTGVADLFWPYKTKAFAGMYIEMKRPGEKPTVEQVEFGAYVIHQGYYWTVCDNWRQAADLIMYYMWERI